MVRMKAICESTKSLPIRESQILCRAGLFCFHANILEEKIMDNSQLCFRLYLQITRITLTETKGKNLLPRQ